MRIKTSLLSVAVALAVCFGDATFAETVKIAHIDPYSGPAAGVNQTASRLMEWSLEMANKEKWAGPNVTFEMVKFDGKNSSPESLLQLKSVADQGIHYVVQGLSSAVGLALIDGVNRHNERNPGKEIVFLTPSDVATEMTNEKCSFWFFRFDSNVDMRTEGLVAYLAKDKAVKKVYLVNQNYATGQQVSTGFKTSMKNKRPDIEIVGDDLHPMMQVKDFAPYVAKIKASGADSIVTSSWGADLTLLIKAMKDAGLKVPMYTFNAATTGIPTALAAANVDNVKVITFWTANDNPKVSKPLVDSFKAKYNEDFASSIWYTTFRMLAQAMKDAKSTQPLAVARTLEGMRFNALNGEVQMRKADHQIQQPLMMAEFKKVNGKDVVFDMENTGYGFKTTEVLDAYISSLPTSCQMKRP